MRRLDTGGRIDRTKPLSVEFNGRSLPAFQGDTLSSAMLAGGVSLVGRSFKYHRPRGIYSAGVEEPNAMVHLRRGHRLEPNVRATVTEAFEGLISTSQNAWPKLEFDVSAINNWLSPFFSAGFYYKTFIGPFKHSTKFWMMCETFIRKAAGMGRATYLSDPDRYEKRTAFCDVLVIGAGVAGLSAAMAAGRSGVQVMLIEQDYVLGGDALADAVGGAADDWILAARRELEEIPNVTILTRTTAFGAYDGNTYGLIERASDHVLAPGPHQVRQRYWLVHAKRSILATGAIERPLVFGGNDIPGVMLAGAARTYLNRFAVLAGNTVVIGTNNDSAYTVAADLAHAGAAVTLADTRPSVGAGVTDVAANAGVSLLLGHGILSARGRKCVTRAVVAPIDAKGRVTGPRKTVACDLIATSGGWSPSVHLWSQLYSKPVYCATAACFVPAAKEDQLMRPAGTATAANSLLEVIEQGFSGGVEAAKAAGCTLPSGDMPEAFATGAFWQSDASPVWAVFDEKGKLPAKAFIDFQHDVKASDIDQAHLEGYLSVEHLKRYTTTGMGTDQGKLSSVNALARMADLRNVAINDVGTTTFRPPYTPISVGSVVGHEHGRNFRPTRLSPIHHWHMERGAKMIQAGAWVRSWYYPEKNEDLRSASIREAGHVREHVGMIDVSSLGKIAVQGPDSAEFLNRMYVNGWKKLSVGRLRYGVMLREDGFVMDDGATARLGEHDYFMSTTTANAAKVLELSEHLLQTAWRDLRVHVTSITDQWAAIAIAGPKARDLLSKVTNADLSRATLPNNHFAQVDIGGVKVRIHRMSYSGELAYEVYAPSSFGRHVWEEIYSAGSEFNLRAYGSEAMGILRIEKGHVAGPELDGRTTLNDLGMDGLASSKKAFVGSVLRKRPVLEDPERPTLVGLEISGEYAAKAGSILFPQESEISGHGDGWVSSATYSPALGKNIAMAFLKQGMDRIGETVRVINLIDNEELTARVVSHYFFDAEGERQNG